MRARVPFLLLLLLLAGCGFHLRGYQQTTPELDGLYIAAAEQRESLAGVLRRQLRSAGVRLAATPEGADKRLRILDERFTQRVLSVDGNGKALEYELRLRVRFALAGADGVEQPQAQPLDLVRRLLLSGEDELAQRNELTLLKADMREELASRLIRRLQAHFR